MPLLALPAVFMRGGTSRAVMFHARDLPDRARMGPDLPRRDGQPRSERAAAERHGRRHLVAVEGLHPGAVGSRRTPISTTPSPRCRSARPRVDYRSNCGNMSSAVGPFAVDEGIVRPNGDTAVVRIFNTNTRKIIRSTFPLDGRPRGDRRRPGDPRRGRHRRAGAAGLPRARRRDHRHDCCRPASRSDRLDVPGVGPIEVSMVDAANACVFVRARDLGLTGRELPEELERDPALLERLQRSAAPASVAMGIARDDAEARDIAAVPIIGFVAPPMDAPTLSGEPIAAGAGRPDGAVPVERPAAPGPAADRLAVHRGRGQHRRHAGGRGAGARRRRAGADRHAVRHPDRGRRGGAGQRRPMGGAQRRVLPHRPAAVRRPHLRPALGMDSLASCSHGSVAQASPVRRVRPPPRPSRSRHPANSAMKPVASAWLWKSRSSTTASRARPICTAIASGSPAGAARPRRITADRSSPSSRSGGISGKTSVRLVAAMPRPISRPSRRSPIALDRPSAAAATLPATAAWRAAAAEGNATMLSRVPPAPAAAMRRDAAGCRAAACRAEPHRRHRLTARRCPAPSRAAWRPARR